jgi:hypothetical protein
MLPSGARTVIIIHYFAATLVVDSKSLKIQAFFQRCGAARRITVL